MTYRMLSVPVLALAAFMFAGCTGTTPNTEEKRESLESNGSASLKEMTAQDPSLNDFIKKSYAYAIFPSIGEGGFIVGGAYGKGLVYEGGRLIGYADVTQGKVGFLAGGKTFSELICFESKPALDRFTNNQLTFTAEAAVVVLKSGAGAAAKYESGVAVFVHQKGGLMAGVSLGGQKFTYSPATMAPEK